MLLIQHKIGEWYINFYCFIYRFYYFTRPHCSSYPAHVSYAPVSAQDSEQQSLSSDALTDDTVSLTDTSSM